MKNPRPFSLMRSGMLKMPNITLSISASVSSPRGQTSSMNSGVMVSTDRIISRPSASIASTCLGTWLCFAAAMAFGLGAPTTARKPASSARIFSNVTGSS